MGMHIIQFIYKHYMSKQQPQLSMQIYLNLDNILEHQRKSYFMCKVCHGLK